MSNVGQWTTSSGILMINSAEVEKIGARVRILGSAIRDLRPLFEQMANAQYKAEKEIFTLQGPGQYADLSTKPYFFKRRPGETGPRGGKYITMPGGYKQWKQYYYGFTYPILFASGRLASSLLSRTAKDAICEIEPRGMNWGTSVPYAGPLHMGTGRMRERPLWMLGEGSKTIQRWNRLIDAYMQKAVDGAIS